MWSAIIIQDLNEVLCTLQKYYALQETMLVKQFRNEKKVIFIIETKVKLVGPDKNKLTSDDIKI